MKVRNLDVGVESISRWQVRDEVHLPDKGPLKPNFLPRHRPLDDILRRPSLDERLPKLLEPATLDPDLLSPAVLTQVRMETRALFRAQALRESGRKRDILEAAAECLEEDVEMDDEVRRSLAALLRG